MMHSSTIAGSMPARRTDSATTSAPSCVAERDFSAPRNLPVGVRTAETMTVSRALTDGNLRDGVCAEHVLQALQDDPRRTAHFARPLRAGGVDEERLVLEPHARLAIERGADGRTPRVRHLALGQRRTFEEF